MMKKKIHKRWLIDHKKLLILLLAIISTAVISQEINWFSIDGGGGISSNGNTQLIGVIGQSDTVRMSSGDISISGGYLPLPATIQDIIFKNGFE